MKHTMLLCALTVVCGAGSAHAQLPAEAALTLVRDGQPESAIVLAENPTKVAQLAAFDLQHHLRVMSGAEVPILREPLPLPPGTPTRILIGESRATKALGIDTAGLNRQEQILFVKGADLALIGRDNPLTGDYRYGDDWFAYGGMQGLDGTDEMGTFFAVCTLLETLGVRWYWPGELGTVMPRTNNIVVPSLNVRKTPFMGVCRFNGHNPMPLDRMWVNPFRPETKEKSHYGLGPGDLPLGQLRFASSVWRLRNKSPRGIIEDNHSKLLCSYLLRDTAKTHPEFWGTHKPAQGNQLCLTNTQLIDQVAADIIDALTGKEDRVLPTLHGIHIRSWKQALAARQVSLGPADTANFCQCPACTAMLDPGNQEGEFSGFSKGTHSRYVWTFVARVAEKVKIAAPDAKIVCFAYWLYFFPPEGVALPDNVLVPICVHWPYHNDPRWVEYERRTIGAWNKVAPDRLSIYAYYLFPRYSTFLTAPAKLGTIPTWNLSFCAPRLLATELKHAAGEGARGFTAELSSWPLGSGVHDNVVWDHLNLYVTWKLSEDPTVEVEALLAEYYRLFYGPAEAPMGKFWDGLEALYMAPDRTNDAWTAAQVGKLGQFIAEARAAAPELESPYRQRLEMVNDGVFNILDDSRKLRGEQKAER